MWTLETEDSLPLVLADRARLFAPFFSTKADGRGRALTPVREILVHHVSPFSLTGPEGGPTRFVFSLKRA